MNHKTQSGEIRLSALINIALGAGILIAIIILLYINLKPEDVVQTTSSVPKRSSNTTAAPTEVQVDDIKTRLEIETLKLEQLRIQTEKVRAQQRREQSVAPTPTTPQS